MLVLQGFLRYLFIYCWIGQGKKEEEKKEEEKKEEKNKCFEFFEI